MLERSRLVSRIGTVCAAAGGLGATVLIASALASGDWRPTITGDPIVGHVLTANLPATEVPTAETTTSAVRDDDGDDDLPLFKWQGCDPAVSDCSGESDDDDDRSSRSVSDDDSPWTDLTEASATGDTYTVQPSDLGHLIRVVVRTEGHHHHWRASEPVGPVTQEVKVSPPPPIEPEHGISFLAKPAGGTVTVKEPGASDFTPLDGLEKIPVDSVIDTRGGTVNITAATGNLGDTTEDNSVSYWDGLIRIEQSGDVNAAATAKLVQKLHCGKRSRQAKATKSSGPVATVSRKSRRRVWGSGHGNYKTSGGGGTGSVRGTTWLTKDTCRGTFFKVTDGIGITVFDFDLGQSFDLGPGQSYFARNR